MMVEDTHQKNSNYASVKQVQDLQKEVLRLKKIVQAANQKESSHRLSRPMSVARCGANV
jgi:hypothetical protein